MHTFEADSIRFHYNSDMSGQVEIAVGNVSLEVAGEALVAFMQHLLELDRQDELELAQEGISAEEIQAMLRIPLPNRRTS